MTGAPDLTFSTRIARAAGQEIHLDSKAALTSFNRQGGSIRTVHADGSRWDWAPGGTPDGGTIIAASGGGVWVRQAPAYSAAQMGSIQGALTAAPSGYAVDAGMTATTAPLVTDASRSLYGRGIYAPITLEGGTTTRDLLTIRPPTDGNQYAGMTLRDLLLVASTGRNAITVDLTGAGRRVARLKFDNIHAIAGTGYALSVQNELDELDAISNSYVYGGSYAGGIEFVGAGDSIALRDVLLTGAHGLTVTLNNLGAGGGGADASQFLASGLNSTGATGIYVITGTRFRLEYSNLELPTGGAGSGGALVYLQGGADAGGRISGATIMGNYLAPIQPGKNAIRLGNTDGTQITENTITAPATTYAVVIDGNARNTYVGPNRWECSPGYEVQDGGLGTMGVNKSVTLTGGRTPTTNRPAPSFLKLPTSGNEGRVTLSGSVTGGSLTGGDVITTFPVGFRPATVVNLPMWVVTDTYAGWTVVTINTNGDAAWAATVTGTTLTELTLSGAWQAAHV